MSKLLAVSATRPEGDWPEQLDLTVFARLLEDISPAASRLEDVEDARRIRDDMAAVLLDGSQASALAHLNHIAEKHALVPWASEGKLGLRSMTPTSTGAVWSEILFELMIAVSEGCRSSIRRCESDPCITPFLAVRETSTRNYCCTRCATRDRVRRHREVRSA